MTQPINLLDADLFEIRGQSIWLDFGTHEVVVRIPKSQKVTLWKRPKSATLNLGSVNKITISITGPLDQVTDLYRTLTTDK
jgi:hypothetical protein